MVDPLSFHALTFNSAKSCLEHSDLLTVTTAGASLECKDSEVAYTLPKELSADVQSRIRQNTAGTVLDLQENLKENYRR